MKKLLSILAMALVGMTASAYDLTIGETAHGTVTFKVNNATVTTANAGDVVTVCVAAGKGYISDGVTARAYTSFSEAKAPRRSPGAIDVLDWQTVTLTEGTDSAYTFTMPAAHVVVNAAYAHRALTNDMIEAIADQTWTGSAVEPVLVVKDRAFTLIEDVDYTVSYSNNTDKGVNTATATITAKSDIDDYYLGTASANFSIRKLMKAGSGFSAYATSETEGLIYTGQPIEPLIVVRDGRKTLTPGEDYTVEYSENITATSPGQFKVTGIGSYSGELEGTFTINTCDLSRTEVGALTGIVFTGDALTPSLTITYNGMTLVEGDDTNGDVADFYADYTNNVDTGTATVRIEGVNNYSGWLDYTFNIDAKALTEDMIAPIADLTYDGNAKEPAPVVTYGDITLNAGTDYTVSYENNVNAGTATLTITSTALNNNYSGSASKTFTIQKADATITNPTVKTGLVYTSEPQALLNAGTVEGGEMQYSLDGVDYTSTVSTGTDAGTYTVYYKTVGDENHKDVAAATLTVSIAKADLTTMTLAQNTFTYNKTEQEAQVATVSAGTIPVATENFDVSGNKQTNVGTYTATVTAKSTSTNFKGSATAQWSIVEADAQIFTMELDPESFVFTGNAFQPAVTVKDGEDVLTLNTDYTLAFENNVDAGTAKVTATGKGNYKNTQEATFTIQKANAQLGTAPAAKTLTYNRSAQELVTAGTITVVGTTDESKLQYSLDGVNFSDDIPTATEAGSYTVTYYVKGDKNHNDTQPLTVECAIQKDQGTMAFTEAGYELTYGDVNFTNAIDQYGDNDIRFVSSDPRVAEVHYFTGEVTIKGVGQCTITAMMLEHKNFKKQTADITYTVTVAPREITEENVTVGEVGENGVPEVTVSVEAPVGMLTPLENTDYRLAYYDNTTDRNAVTVEQMNANPGEYVAVLTFFGNYAGYVEKTITVGSAQGPIPGDVTNSGVVEMDDVEDFINDILNGDIPTDPTSDAFIRFDANQDGRIDIADAQAILNLAMGLNADGTQKVLGVRRQDPVEASPVTMRIEREDMGDGVVRYALSVSGDVRFTGFQADVVTDGRILSQSLAVSGMQMRTAKQKNGALRILGLPGSAEQQADGAVAYVYVLGAGALTFENVVLTTADARSISVSGEATSISEELRVKSEEFAPAIRYTLDGRKVRDTRKGIVISGGKKVVKK